MAKRTTLWKPKPEARDFFAAQSYLALLCNPARAKAVVQRLRRLKPVEHHAKDLLRASGLPLLLRNEPRVEDDFKRLRKGKRLRPVLLVRGDLARGLPLVIADGYHRICAAYHHDVSRRHESVEYRCDAIAAGVRLSRLWRRFDKAKLNCGGQAVAI